MKFDIMIFTVIMISIGGIAIAVVAITDMKHNIESSENPKQYCDNEYDNYFSYKELCKCYYDCEKINATFINYEYGSNFKNEKCSCYKDNGDIIIW
jgi:hypothetical protein